MAADPVVQAPVETTESAAPQQTTLEAEYEKALAEHPIPEEGSKPEAPPTQAAPADTGQAAEEPEHLKWVKSQSGFVDPATGQVNTDTLAKQAYELNRAFQTQAQNLNQIGTLLRHPIVAAALQQVTQGAQPQGWQPPAAPSQDGQPEKTEEQILADFVKSQIDASLAPLQQQAALLYRNFEASQTALAYQRLKQDFGTTKIDGREVAVIDAIGPQLGQQLSTAAARAGVPIPTLVSYLVQNDMFYETLNNAAKTILFPTLQQQTAQAQTTAQQTTLEKQKRTTLTGKSSGSTVRQGTKQIKSFADAVAAAEEELAQKQ